MSQLSIFWGSRWIQLKQIRNCSELPPITETSPLKPHQSKGNETKRHSLDILPILCTVESALLFLLSRIRPLNLLPTTEFSPFENSRNLPLLKQWEWVTRTHSLLLIISLLASKFQKKTKQKEGSMKQVNKNRKHFYVCRNPVMWKRTKYVFQSFYGSICSAHLLTLNEHDIFLVLENIFTKENSWNFVLSLLVYEN